MWPNRRFPPPPVLRNLRLTLLGTEAGPAMPRATGRGAAQRPRRSPWRTHLTTHPTVLPAVTTATAALLIGTATARATTTGTLFTNVSRTAAEISTAPQLPS